MKASTKARARGRKGGREEEKGEEGEGSTKLPSTHGGFWVFRVIGERCEKTEVFGQECSFAIYESFVSITYLERGKCIAPHIVPTISEKLKLARNGKAVN
jgi:hypothetical protein